MDNNFRNGVIRWQISKSKKGVREHFVALALTVPEIITFEIFCFENVGEGYGM